MYTDHESKHAYYYICMYINLISKRWHDSVCKVNSIRKVTKAFVFQVWFQNRRAKFRKQERLAQQKAGEAPVKAEGKRDKPSSPAPSPHPAPSAPVPQPAHHALPHLSPPDLKPITSAGNLTSYYLCESYLISSRAIKTFTVQKRKRDDIQSSY